MVEISKDTAEKLLRAAEQLEQFRTAVNQAYTVAPKSMDFDFSSALDQLADHQYKLSQTWRMVMEGDEGGGTTEAARTVEEAQRVASLTWRALAEARQEEAERIESKLLKTHGDYSELVRVKGDCEALFRKAAELHEKDEPSALEQLRTAADRYADYSRNAKAKITGTQTITARERRRQLLVYISIILAALAFIGRDNIVNAFKWIWSLLSKS